MKTKFLFAGLLFASLAANAQLVETSIETGAGLDNGAARGTLVTDATPGSTFIGYRAGYTTDGKTNNGPNNTFVGNQTGYSNTLGYENAYFGGLAGYTGTTAAKNTFIGFKSGYSNTTGYNNVFTGWQSGFSNTTGYDNTFYGYSSGNLSVSAQRNTSIGNLSGRQNNGFDNVFLGHGSGYSSTTGFYNTFIGSLAGYNSTGNGNVFIGCMAGWAETSSHNKLCIANYQTSTPLIYGEFDNKKLTFNGKVSITDPTDQAALFPSTSGSVSVANYFLFVKGGILTEEVRVHMKASGGWADYVFADGYKLKPLSEVERYITENGHLQNIPSAKEVKENGLELGQMANLQQEKIEELTLYAIQQDKQLEAQDKQLEEQKSQLDKQQKEIDELKAAVKALAAKQ